MKTINNFVACAPFQTTSIRAEVKRGVALIQQKHELTKLKVVLPSRDDRYFPGDDIWVLGEAMKHAYAEQVFQQDGISFILVPYDVIRGHDDEQR